jgi:argonaute-like protein implicated in RNA metabolism and viral defense
VTKKTFLTHQIPVQEFEIETTALPDRQLGYVLNNMALATYAKLGGIPWLIKSDPTIAHELVIGLGSANVGQGRLGERERVVGITTVFSGDGNYWLSNLTRSVPFSEYQKALLDSLGTTIAKVRQSMNWQPKDHVRLVFHAFKPFKNTEAQAVKDLMAELGDYDVDYAFLHVVEHHPYLLFDRLQKGIIDYETQARKGAFAPARGGYLRLSEHEVLLILTGPNDVKRPEDGLPRPVLLHLHRESSFKDTTYLARQAYSFACHSWRSFFPAPFPVTILYSELIAKLLGQLSTIPRWDPDVMLGRLGRSRWFL